MAVPTTPHLNWGGTTCPGARWPEWVPQLRDEALAEEDDLALTAKQAETLQAIHDLVKYDGKIQHRLRAIRDQNNKILEAIAGIGTASGPSADAIATRVADKLAARLKA